jgi:hypothetical protein
MTAVKQLLKELQEKFPKQMADMYDSNQLLLEAIALKAKEMEKQEKIEFACKVAEVSSEKYIQGKTTEQIAKELNKSE